MTQPDEPGAGSTDRPHAGRLDPHVERFLHMVAAGKATGADIADRRASLRQLASFGAGECAGVATRMLEISGPAGTISARLYEPQGVPATSPGLVYCHGGGFVAGDLETHDGVCRQLAQSSGSRLVAVDYRLAPEHPLPAAYDDAHAALLWVHAKADHLGIDPSRLAIGGDSVGAALAALVCHALRGSPVAIACQLLICPVLDIDGDRPSRRLYGRGYFLEAETIRADALACGICETHRPLHFPLERTDFAGLPPALVHTAEFDMVRDDGADYARLLEAAGVPARLTCHQGMVHYFYALGRLVPKSRPILESIGADLSRALAGPALPIPMPKGVSA